MIKLEEHRRRETTLRRREAGAAATADRPAVGSRRTPSGR
jgi:hypothetical protein